MRTTLTLDPDVAALLEREAHRLRRPIKQIVNDALRRGLTGTAKKSELKAFVISPHPGQLRVGIDRLALNRLADELEDSSVLAKRST